jgi:hypothetical protein
MLEVVRGWLMASVLFVFVNLAIDAIAIISKLMSVTAP